MPERTLQRLIEGNRRFSEGRPMLDESTFRREAIAKKQDPFAIILGCADSRVPPELIFDQGLGELFVIRTAGETLDRAVLGTLEFGVLELKIPLIVVLGHERCGAIKAARDTLHRHEKADDDIEYLVEELALAVQVGDEGDEANEHETEDLDRAARGQVIADVAQLKKLPALQPALEKGELKIVGGWYDLDTGLVEIIIE